LQSVATAFLPQISGITSISIDKIISLYGQWEVGTWLFNYFNLMNVQSK
jgi:hypothetical protein